MNEQEIQKDRNDRADACKKELEAVLSKYQFALTAEDNWTPNTKIKVEIAFQDFKKYDAAVAEAANPSVPLGQTATPTAPTETVVEATPVTA